MKEFYDNRGIKRQVSDFFLNKSVYLPIYDRHGEICDYYEDDEDKNNPLGNFLVKVVLDNGRVVTVHNTYLEFV